MRPALLVLHGVTMSGASMLRHLGPLRGALEAAGFDLIAPDGAHAMSDDEVERLVGWLARPYGAFGQDPRDWFNAERFWEGGHYGWFDSETLPDGRKHYRALEPGLENIRRATEGRHVVGILGFSQGCAMAAVVTGVALRSARLPFGDTLRFGIYICGFKPGFDVPKLDLWPVGPLPALVLSGSEDPLFADIQGVHDLAAVFTDPEVHRIEGLGHEVPHDPAWVARIADFARAHAPG
ncbi:MAG: hypothetical protein H6739_38685 [Alphaproteobacteria bacterium]|nr:hypothetical protein [Alphaproteobacteria bacterium]